MKVTEKKSPKPKRSTICLNMIVKDESHIIEKTLNNIVSKITIDYWVISDTGSTDNTKELIVQFFKTVGIPGELVEHPWFNFGYNRTKALECAFNKTDYLFIFDADDEIVGDLKFPVSLERDKYFLKFGTDFSYVRPLLVNNRKHWIFEGVLHEYLTNAIGETCEAGGPTINGNYYLQSNRLGARSNDPDKYSKDAEILRKAFDEAIERNYGLACRYAFYCANSYKDAGPRYANDAIYWYKKTVSLNGWIQEKWNSYFQLGLINRALGNIPEAIFFWLEAYNCLPDRISINRHFIKRITLNIIEKL
jgi:glycosyltransferase involved in cell wall biosynthesis